MAIISRIKLWLLIVATAYGTYQAAWSARVAQREHGPTRLTAADFSSGRYHGQQWLTVTGNVDPAEAITRPERREKLDVWLPLRDDTAGPVHVFILLQPMSESDAKARLASLPKGPAEFTGSQVFFDPDRLFPGLDKAGPVVMIAAGNTPGSAATGWTLAGIFGAIFLLAVTGEGLTIYHNLRQRRTASPHT